MKMLLTNESRTPYGGMYVIDKPDAGMVGRGTNWWKLSEDVQRYRRVNGLPIGLGFDDELRALVCEKYPKECEPEPIDGLPKKRPPRVGWREVVLGSKVCFSVVLERLKSWAGVGDSPIVSQEEAERRAKICAGCRYQAQVVLPCGGPCGELKELVQQVVGNRTTSYDSQLQNCGICKCYNNVAVHVDLAMQLAPYDQETRDKFSRIPWCWKKL